MILSDDDTQNICAKLKAPMATGRARTRKPFGEGRRVAVTTNRDGEFCPASRAWGCGERGSGASPRLLKRACEGGTVGETSRKAKRLPVDVRVCRAIRLLAEGRDPVAVAREVRVMPRTLRAWRANDDFRSLVACLRENGQMRDMLAALQALTPAAIAVLRDALESDDEALAVRAARDVLDRVGPLAEQERKQTIRVEYVNPDGQPVSTSPWADRHPAPPGTLQGGGVRQALWEDGDGAHPDD